MDIMIPPLGKPLFYSNLLHANAQTEPARARMRKEIQWIRRMMQFLLYITLVTAFSTIGFAFSSQAGTLYFCALLTSLSAISILMTQRQLDKCRSWTELCVITLCSLYAPFFVLLASFVGLFTYCIAPV